MSASECARFEQKLAFFAAPSLLGIKCASLLSLRKAEFQLSEHIEIFNTRAQVKGLRLKVLCECKNRYLSGSRPAPPAGKADGTGNFTAIRLCYGNDAGIAAGAPVGTHSAVCAISPRNRTVSGLSHGGRSGIY